MNHQSFCRLVDEVVLGSRVGGDESRYREALARLERQRIDEIRDLKADGGPVLDHCHSVALAPDVDKELFAVLIGAP